MKRAAHKYLRRFIRWMQQSSDEEIAAERRAQRCRHIIPALLNNYSYKSFEGLSDLEMRSLVDDIWRIGRENEIPAAKISQYVAGLRAVKEAA